MLTSDLRDIELRVMRVLVRLLNGIRFVCHLDVSSEFKFSQIMKVII